MSIEEHFEKFEKYENLTDEQMARLLTGDGDTAIEEKPALDTEPEVKEELKEEKPVILAKDGVHTIEYEKLVEAREDAKKFKDALEEKSRQFEEKAQQLADREALIESLKTAKQEDEQTGTTEAMDALAALVKEDFPDLLELMDMKSSKVVNDLRAEMESLKKQLSDQIAPVVKSSNEQVEEKFFSEVSKQIPEIYDIKGSPAFVEWVNSHPKAVAEAYHQTWQTGSLADVVAMAKSFQATQKPATVGDTTEDIAKKAAAAEEKAKGKSAPRSLSDIPAGTAAHHDEAEAIKSMTPKAIMEKFANKSPSEIMAMLDRTLK